MTKFKRRITTIITGFTMLGALGVTAGVTSAAASQQQICSPAGNDLCINDTLNGGMGTTLQMWTANKTNEDFFAEVLTRCSGSNGSIYVTDTCPFANHSFDQQIVNTFGSNSAMVIQIVYENTTRGCMAMTETGTVLGKCNGTNGFNGANGTVFVDAPGGYLYSLYMTNFDNSSLECVTEMASDPGDGIYSLPPADGQCDPWTGV